MDKTIIRLDNIAKSFGNVRVIHHISFSIEAGKVYALAGENGAGKSTLCNIISGSLKPDEGTISYGDKEYSSFTIQQAKEIGIKMVHQELQILPLMNCLWKYSTIYYYNVYDVGGQRGSICVYKCKSNFQFKS